MQVSFGLASAPACIQTLQPRCKVVRHAGARCFRVHATEPSVQSLLARDRKLARAADEELPAAFLDEPQEPEREAAEAEREDFLTLAAASLTSSAPAEAEPAEAEPGAAGASQPAEQSESGPRTAGEAIEAGIARLGEGQAQAAVDLFQAALELPGNGAFRLSGTVREYRCASDAEEQSALYNMACAYAAMAQRESALTCLEACLEAGFADFATLRQDPDLAPLRGADLDKLLSRYDGLLAKVFKRRRKQDYLGKKPWFEVV